MSGDERRPWVVWIGRVGERARPFSRYRTKAEAQIVVNRWRALARENVASVWRDEP